MQEKDKNKKTASQKTNKPKTSKKSKTDADKNKETKKDVKKQKSIFSSWFFWCISAGIVLLVVAFIISGAGVVEPDEATCNLQIEGQARRGVPCKISLVLDKRVAFTEGDVVWIVDDVEIKRGSATQQASFKLDYTFDGVGKHIVKSEVEGYENLVAWKEINVEKPLLELKIKDSQKIYGEQNPAVSYEMSGFIEGDNKDTVKLPQLQFDAEQNSDVGEYGIKSVEHAKYEIVAKGGKLKINPKPITLVANNASKVYDGTVDLPQASFMVDGVLFGDEVNADIKKATYSDKRVGKNKAIQIIEGQLSGKDAKNYILGNKMVFGGEISAKKLSVEGIKASNKFFDGGTSVTFDSIGSFVGVESQDDVQIGKIVARFDSPQAGKQKRVVVEEIKLLGDDAENYVVEMPQNLSADIYEIKKADKKSVFALFFLIASIYLHK